jgi:hypothetical protein
MDNIKADCVSRIPREAYILDKDGRPAGVAENNPAYQAVEKEYKARLKALRAAQPDARFDGLEQICKDKALGDGIGQSLCVPADAEPRDQNPGHLRLLPLVRLPLAVGASQPFHEFQPIIVRIGPLDKPTRSAETDTSVSGLQGSTISATIIPQVSRR